MPQGDNHYNIHLGNPLVDPQEHLRLVIPHANGQRVTDRSAHRIGFCGFLVLIEMKFWYARMIFRTNEHIAKAIKLLVTYLIIIYYIDLSLFFNMLTPIKKQGDEHIYILL